jgi:hypothetical protein
VARQHGTRAKAIRDGCKCVACRIAAADYERERRARRRPSWRVRRRRGRGEIFEVVDREGIEVVLVTRDRADAEAEAARRRNDAHRNGDPGPRAPYATEEDLVDLCGAFETFDTRSLGTRRIADLAGLDPKTVRAASLAARRSTNHRPRRETVEAILSAMSRLRD